MRLRDLWAWWTRDRVIQTKADAFRYLFEQERSK